MAQKSVSILLPSGNIVYSNDQIRKVSIGREARFSAAVPAHLKNTLIGAAHNRHQRVSKSFILNSNLKS